MLDGTSITLRPVREADLETLYSLHTQIAARGDFFPRNIASQPAFVRAFTETGFWEKNEGMLLVVDADDAILGHVEFFRTVDYLDELELSYILYSTKHRGKGVMTEAVALITRYLFETKPTNRIRLVIHPDNVPSRRLAEKCGYRHEGTARGAWYNNGRHQDVEIYAILHDDVIG
jgi:[ribosomal protein S5]-alanine N-acetyltransferase